MELVPLAPLALDVVTFRTRGGAVRLTAVAKITCSLASDVARLIDPEPVRGDVLEGRTLRASSDLVPRKARADVVFFGSAHSAVATREREVRIVLARGGVALLDKRLRIVSEEPFTRMPLVYERAFGGATSKTNPVGVGGDPGDRRAPNVLDPAHPKRTAGFAPVPSTWWWRSRLLAGHDFEAVESLQSIPEDLDLAYFNGAPPDQQIAFLRGDEELRLFGLIEGRDELQVRLPGVRAHVLAEIDDDGAPPREIALVLDTLAIDGDALRCTLTFRGAVDVPREDVRARLLGTICPIGAEPSWAHDASSAPEVVRGSISSRAAAEHPRRTSETLPVVNVTPFVAITLPARLRPPREARVVIVKSTWDLVEDGPAAIAQEQLPPIGDERHHDGESVRYSSDFVPFKPRADVLLVGHAYPGDRPSVAHVHFEVGAMQRAIAVFGDRTWDSLGAQSSPAPFDRMPLRWERALGGPLSERNPVGRGYGTGLLAPNLERPEALVSSPGDVPPPACFAPIDPSWRRRRDKLGTYDASWLRERWPGFPEDFDWSYFNAAPPEQQVPWLSGGERYLVTGVTEGGGALRGKLPEVRPRAFAAAIDGRFFEILLRLDTVFFDADARKLVLVHRGLVEVDDDEASELSSVFVLEGDASLEEAHARYLREVEPKKVPSSPPLDPVPPARPPSRALIESWLLAEVSLAGKDLSGADLRDLDLEGHDLSRCTLFRADLRGARLAGANLKDAVLAEARADAVDFAGADLARADLEGATLAGASFERAKLVRASLRRAICTDARFVDAELSSSTFAKADLARARFDRAQAARADFTASILDDARFVDAVLDDAKLYEVSAERAHFDRASLKDARLDGGTFTGASFERASAEGASAANASFERANLLLAKLSSASFVKARLAEATLSKADLRGASFRKADLQRARLLRANATGASFERADLRRADVRGASLYRAELWEAKLEGAELAQAHLASTKLE